MLALLGGAIMAGLTLSILGLGYPSEIPLMGDPRPALVTFLFPGMLGAAFISSNAHAWPLWLAALVNGAIYFALIWIVGRLCAIIFRKVSQSRP